jgi:hypothetical protein
MKSSGVFAMLWKIACDKLAHYRRTRGRIVRRMDLLEWARLRDRRRQGRDNDCRDARSPQSIPVRDDRRSRVDEPTPTDDD